MASFAKVHKQPYEALTKIVQSKPLRGKNVLITGAGRGVGQHIARSYGEGGASRIGMLGRDKARIEKAKEDFAMAFPLTEWIAYTADITDEETVAAVFKAFGVPDILINNAGDFPDEGPFIKQDMKRWWKGFEINILGTAIVTQQYLKAKGPEQSGIVLSVSSLVAHFRLPLTGWSGYNATKTGQARFFEYLRFEHPEVRFISIHPGLVDSDGLTRSGTQPKEYTDGQLTGDYFVWAATDEADFLKGRFAWAEWDIDELRSKKDQILKKDQLLLTLEGLDKGM